MLRRRIVRLCPLLLTLSLGCQKPPATDTTTPDDATAATTETEPATSDAPPEAPLPAAQDVLAKSIEALGGKAAIEAVKSSYTEAKTEIKAQGLSLVTHIWSKGDNFYIESDMPGVGLSQVWKRGDDIWSKDPINGLRKLEGKEAAQARWSSDPLLAANWNKYFATAETIGRSKDGDRELLEVKLGNENGDALVLLFDAKTSMPAGQVFEQETPMGAMKIRITVGDYREVEGVMVPFRSVTDMQLMSAVQTTEKYEVNVEVDDAKFDPPLAVAPAKAEGKDKPKDKSKPKAKAKAQ
jgi:hypothetical protein